MPKVNHCPLCGENNHCALASDSNAKGCWCQQQTFNDAVIKQAQKAKQPQQCICQPCAQKALRLASAAQ